MRPKSLLKIVFPICVGGEVRVGGPLLPSQVATTHGLESHDDIGDLQVSLLFQVGQDPGPEEDFALSDPVQVGVEFQGFDLQKEGGQEFPFSAVPCGQGSSLFKARSPPKQLLVEPPEPGRFAAGFLGRGWGRLTMRMQACFPSMKPFGMAFAARISYLETQGRSHQPRASPSFLPLPAPLTHHPACARPSRLTAGGTPGRQSCWGSPGGRYGCLLTPRCTAAAPALETHPACQTAKAERAMGHQVWHSGSSRPPSLRPA